jgi:glycosyltransferase involved in cell wall biosynthesis
MQGLVQLNPCEPTRTFSVPLDVVIPAHNEELRIDHMLETYRSAIRSPDVRFHVALDRCVDRTATIVERHAAVDPRVVLHHYPKLGKGGVIMETFRQCRGELVGFVDADGATPPGEFLRLINAASSINVDAAIAVRHHPAAVLPAAPPFARRVTSLVFAHGVRRLFGLPFADTQCGAKVLSRQLVERCLPLLSSRDFLFDVDLLLTSVRLGFRVVEVPTVWLHREGSRLRTVSDARRMALSSLRLWVHHRILPVMPEDDEEARRLDPLEPEPSVPCELEHRAPDEEQPPLLPWEPRSLVATMDEAAVGEDLRRQVPGAEHGTGGDEPAVGVPASPQRPAGVA